MDKETEDRIAKLIIEEAAMQRKQADREGVHVYLTKPTTRVRPNPQFLRATMRSVEQSNRIVEVNDMWRRRKAELELDRKSKRRRDDDDSRSGSRTSSSYSSRRNDRERLSRYDRDRSVDEEEEDGSRDRPACSHELRDEDVEQFLNKRVKRGRGSVGSRMDETGPYLAATEPVPEVKRTKEAWETRLIGPRLPEKAEAEWKRTKMDDEGVASNNKSRDEKKKKHNREKNRESRKSSD